MRDDIRGVSTVLATVIMVAVAITLAIVVAYWTGALSFIFMREKIEMKGTYVRVSGAYYVITVQYKNTGSMATGIDTITLNGIPSASYTYRGTPIGVPTFKLDGVPTALPAPAEIGVTHTLIIIFTKGSTDPSGNQLSPGVTCTIDLHSTGGKDYTVLVALV